MSPPSVLWGTGRLQPPTLPPDRSFFSFPCSLPEWQKFSRRLPPYSHPVIGLSMVNPFHLHNCGNSVDIVELLFPFLPLCNPFLSINFHNFNHLECIRLQSLWHFVCS